MIVLDTNVISELLRPTPAPQVEAWLAAQDGTSIYFTAVGEAKLRHGLAILLAGDRRSALGAAIARAHGASVATRNTSDYERCGIALIDPWDRAGTR